MYLHKLNIMLSRAVNGVERVQQKLLKCRPLNVSEVGDEMYRIAKKTKQQVLYMLTVGSRANVCGIFKGDGGLRRFASFYP